MANNLKYLDNHLRPIGYSSLTLALLRRTISCFKFLKSVLLVDKITVMILGIKLVFRHQDLQITP